ncbi:2220_t:CDS:2 [Paraglomus brasilianum]|uniref:2220_t:CDS:1 n=1 Tax=Paraglomus brasilianum TaxID=144538 RepID=A0A9N8Z366_9GLOM|nr:2220_t:CDS:2 [Paraglomus brasilianum]
MPSLKKGHWSATEDKLVLELHLRHGSDWKGIAAAMNGARDHKQVRERYVNHLDPSINHDRFSIEEERALVKWNKIEGPQWAVFARRMRNGDGFRRTALQVKNFFHRTACRKNKRQKDAPMEQQAAVDERPNYEGRSGASSTQNVRGEEKPRGRIKSLMNIRNLLN